MPSWRRRGSAVLREALANLPAHNALPRYDAGTVAVNGTDMEGTQNEHAKLQK